MLIVLAETASRQCWGRRTGLDVRQFSIACLVFCRGCSQMSSWDLVGVQWRTHACSSVWPIGKYVHGFPKYFTRRCQYRLRAFENKVLRIPGSKWEGVEEITSWEGTLFLLLSIYYYNDQMSNVRAGHTTGMGRWEMWPCTILLTENLKGRKHSRNFDVGGRTLKCFIHKFDVVWIQLA